MYKVIIVDDESLIIEGLKISIDWEQNGFQIIGHALNGVDALELIQKSEPDIVFTDIRMPGLTGLELMKKVSETNPGILFIVISGYAEFAYVQKAMKQGAIGYCLKPFDEGEILNTLKKAKSILSKVRQDVNGDDLFDLLEDYSADSQQKILNRLKGVNLDIDNASGIMVITSIGQGTLRLPENTKYLVLRLGFNKKVYLLQNPYYDGFWSYLENQLSMEIVGIGVVSTVNQICKLKNAIIESMIAAYQFFTEGKKNVYFEIPSDTRELDNYLKKLDSVIQQKDTVSVQESFLGIKNLFSEGCMNIRNAFKVYNLITSFIFKYFDEEIETAIDDYEQLVSTYENVYEMLDDLRKSTIKQCGLLQNDIPHVVDNTVVKQIVEYINSNFHSIISVQNLSEKFFISPNYISFLFKRAIGENFKEYLAKVRINYACELLKNTKYPIQKVSEKAGYSDYFYFSRIFKSRTGLTPSGYRDEFGQEK